MSVRRSIKNISFVLIVNLVVLVVAGEAAFRLFFPDRGPPTYSQAIAMANSGYYRESDVNGYSLERNYVGLHGNQDRNLEGEPTHIQITTNNEGFRTTPRMQGQQCEPDQTKRVLMLGDSYTFGVYLRDENTYPSELQRLFDESGKCFRVINAGYANGHDPDNIYVWLLHNIAKLDPDFVIFNVYGGNDITGINRRYWLETSPQTGLPHNWRDPRLWVSNGHLYRKKQKPPYYIYSYPLLRESKLLVYFERVSKTFYTTFFARLLNKEIGFSSQNLHHLYGDKDSNPTFRSQEKSFLSLVAGMKALSKLNDSQFVTVYMPANYEVYPAVIDKVLPDSIHYSSQDTPSIYGKDLCEQIKELNVECLDITTKMLEDITQSGLSADELLAKNHFYPVHGEVHMSKSGTRFTAKEVFRFYFTANE